MNIFLGHLFQELLRANSGSGVDRKLHLRDLLVNLLHEVDDKVHELVAQHLLGVEVGDQEADVVTLDLLPPQDDKVLRPPHHETHELVAQQLLYVICLLDGDGHPAVEL